MRYIIVRTCPDLIDIRKYNVQEIGLAKAIIKAGHKCDLILYSGDRKDYIEELKFDNKSINIYWFSGRSIFRQAFFNNFNQILELIDSYDIIQINEYNQISSMKILKKFSNKCIIYEGLYRKKKAFVMNLYFKLFDLFFYSKKIKNIPVVTKSNLCEENLRKKFNNILTVGVGLDTSNFIYTEQIKENRNFNILYIGRIEKRRNILFLLEVLKNATAKCENINMTIIGNYKKRYGSKCYKYSKKHNLPVTWMMPIDNTRTAEFYSKSDLFLIPTRYEIFGMVMLESLFFGCPVGTTLNGGASVLINNDNGFIVNEFNVKKWTDEIISIINQNIDRNKLHNKIINNYTWDNIYSKIIEFYTACKDGENL